jgi:hypothetical protein
MELNKSLDEVKVIAAMLHDVHKTHGVVFNTRALKLTLQKVRNRTRTEGLGFLTKTLPRLGKALDSALSGKCQLNAAKVGFDSCPNSQLPRFLGELFSCVFTSDGKLLPYPCAECVTVLRLILYSFYKYKLPYTDEQEQLVINKFKRTEDDLLSVSTQLKELGTQVNNAIMSRTRLTKSRLQVNVARKARYLLQRLFASFDPLEVRPRHGPGAVATRQRLWGKYQWSNVSDRITAVYPLDAYFYASLGHVCDRLQELQALKSRENSARVILVPKDSRGPRLISCEPVDFQWIQQGLGRALVELVERHPLTKWNVFFTNQQPNQFGALYGSETGKYATLDLNEASDRVSVELVRLLFPEHIFVYLEACRSLSTELPDGSILNLNKFAPMGSCLCFPIMALCIWAILSAAAPDADTREGILVYGDDVIVPTAYAADAIEQLESFGLRINRDKSCTAGLFRESCGTDAFTGVNVTPVRFRTVLSSDPSPDVFCSWVAYANSLYKRRYFETYDLIVGWLVSIYGPIPDEALRLGVPSLIDVSLVHRKLKTKSDRGLQKLLYRVWTVSSPKLNREIDGWEMLLRYFCEKADPGRDFRSPTELEAWADLSDQAPFSVRSYTRRRTSMLVRRWR